MSDIPQARQPSRVSISRQRAGVEVLIRHAPANMRRANARDSEIDLARTDALEAVETLRAIEPYQDEVRDLIRRMRRQA